MQGTRPAVGPRRAQTSPRPLTNSGTNTPEVTRGRTGVKGTPESPPACTPNHALARAPSAEMPACPNGVGGAGLPLPEKTGGSSPSSVRPRGGAGVARAGPCSAAGAARESLREEQEDAAFRGSLHTVSWQGEARAHAGPRRREGRKAALVPLALRLPLPGRRRPPPAPKWATVVQVGARVEAEKAEDLR